MENTKEEPCDNCNNDICCCIIKEEPKQETLEEVLEVPTSINNKGILSWNKTNKTPEINGET